MNLNDIEIKATDTAAVNYARARFAIEDTMPNRASKRSAKLVVIDHLHGKIETKTRRFGETVKVVAFEDGTKARF
jgi:hypothetical protein